MRTTAETAAGPVEIPSREHRWTVLFFITEPGIGESLPQLAGCSTGLCSARDAAGAFAAADARILGVSAHAPGALADFERTNSLGYPLVGDADLSLGRALGVPEVQVGERHLFTRATVVLDREGRVRSLVHPVPDPALHASGALDLLAELAHEAERTHG